MEKVGSTEEKLPRGKELKPFEGNSTNPSFCHFAVAALTEEKLPRVKELKPFEGNSTNPSFCRFAVAAVSCIYLFVQITSPAVGFLFDDQHNTQKLLRWKK
jgi:hypothetical protein